MGVLVRHTKRKMIRKGVVGMVSGFATAVVVLGFKLAGDANPDEHLVSLIAEPIAVCIGTIAAGVGVYLSKSAKEDMEHKVER